MAFSTREAAAETMIRDGHTFYRHGWLQGTSGNLSVRLDADTFLITASGRDKGQLTPGDFLVRSLRGDQPPSDLEPSAETEIHEVIYRHLDESGAVYHVHEPYSAFCSERDARVGSTIIAGAEMIKGLGLWDEGARARVPIFANHHDVSRIADDLDAYLAQKNAPPRTPGVNIRSHGYYVWGRDAFEAKRHVETMAYLFRYSWELGNGT